MKNQRFQRALHGVAVGGVNAIEQAVDAVFASAAEDALGAGAPGETAVVFPVAEGGVALGLLQLQAGTPQPLAQALAPHAVAAFEEEDQHGAEQDESEGAERPGSPGQQPGACA